ncbi:hypothetical protein NL676_010830 [Syzygium grande]|nr:hypothetical protein NL676_010830 [Syzygium grande]
MRIWGAIAHVADGAWARTRIEKPSVVRIIELLKIRQFRFTSSFSPTPESEGRIPLVQSRNAASPNIRRVRGEGE